MVSDQFLSRSLRTCCFSDNLSRQKRVRQCTHVPEKDSVYLYEFKMALGVIHTGIGLQDNNKTHPVKKYWSYSHEGITNGDTCLIEPIGSFHTAIRLGSLHGFTRVRIMDIVTPLTLNKFRSKHYNVLTNNCNTFTKTMAEKLGVQKKYPKDVCLYTGCA